MLGAEPTSINLAGVLSSLTGRRVRIGEIITALNVGRSTYYEQRDEGRLISADNLLRLADQMDLNPVELMLQCGLIQETAVVECAGKIGGAGGSRSRTRRFRRRPDAPPL